MSKAPEWIYLDGDVEAGDGMFPRCFENPKYASEPQVEYVRVDLAEAAEQQGYASAMEDARKLHEARIEELEAELLETQDRANAFATKEYYTEMRAERAEAKLAKAVDALQAFNSFDDLPTEAKRPDIFEIKVRQPILRTLAELTGGKDG